MYLDTRLFIFFLQVTRNCDVMTVKTRDNKVTKVLVMMDVVLWVLTRVPRTGRRLSPRC